MHDLELAPITWEATATLVAGALAVLGAVLVGLRQAEISGRQAAIMERQAETLQRQVDLQELDLRTALFERRFKIYRAVGDYVAHFVRHGKEAPRQLTQAFLESQAEAAFAFTPTVTNELERIRLLAIDFETAQSAMEVAQGADREPAVRLRMDTFKALRAARDGLEAIFAQEMNLASLQPRNAHCP